MVSAKKHVPIVKKRMSAESDSEKRATFAVEDENENADIDCCV
jgi:hypothetical protein